MSDKDKVFTLQSKEQKPEFDTKAVHAGRDLFQKGSANILREPTGAVTPPIYMTSTFRYSQEGGYDYTRSGNPNFESLAATMASLENAKFSTVFASGVSAITAVIQTLSSGDLIVLEENVYGCTYRLLEQVYKKFGIRTLYTDLSDPKNYQVILDEKPKLVWVESPTNPLLKIVDLKAVSKIAHQVASVVVVDNTFASAYLQKPLELGADLSLSSTTKYVMGHSACLGGVICTNSKDWNDKMIFQQKACGLQPSPFDAWLTQLGANTLALRMEKHCENGLALAKFFEQETNVNLVRYPFLESHPQYELAKRQMKAGSGIVVVDLGISSEEAKEFILKLKYFAMAESLGGVESLVCHPASMTHASVPKEVREKVGITDSLIRFSVGVEAIQDLISDLRQALPKSLINTKVFSTVSNT